MTQQSMTGFGTVSGQTDGVGWSWELRSVNGKGLDMRLRLPEGSEALEPFVRAAVAKHISRGNITVNLKFSSAIRDAAPTIAPDSLNAMIEAAKHVQKKASEQGLKLAPLTAGDILAQKNIWENGDTCDDAWQADAKSKIVEAVVALVAARSAEGTAIGVILCDQIGQLEKLAKSAHQQVEIRNQKTGGAIREKILAILDVTELADEDRLAQELATISVKADVREELDRLDAHIVAARSLLGEKGPIGRKFDFLMQEFNREANTLCAKSGDSALTTIGLELKVVIDQMREQVQNLE